MINRYLVLHLCVITSYNVLLFLVCLRVFACVRLRVRGVGQPPKQCVCPLIQAIDGRRDRCDALALFALAV